MREEYDEYQPVATSRIQDSVELVKFLIDPTKIQDSPYHLLIPKELAVGQLKREDIYIIELDFALISEFIHMDVPEMALVYHAEMLARVNALRAVEGFERRQESTFTQILKKEGVDSDKKNGLLGGK